MRRRLGLLLIVVVAASMPLLASTARAQTQPPVVGVGWWTDRVLAQEKGEGGFEVARTLDGSSVAAATVDAGGGAVTSATITLTEVEAGSVRADAGVVDVCEGGPFVAADPGELADAPVTECTGGVALERADDGTWTGDITALVGPTTSFLAIVPGPVPDDATPLDPGFVLEFEAPVVALTVTPADDETTPPAPVDTVAPPDFSSPTPSPDFEFTPTPSPSFDDPAPSAPVTTVAPPVDESTSESTEIAGPQLNTAPISGGSGDAKPWIRLLILVPLSVVAGAAAVFGRRRLQPATA